VTGLHGTGPMQSASLRKIIPIYKGRKQEGKYSIAGLFAGIQTSRRSSAKKMVFAVSPLLEATLWEATPLDIFLAP